MNRDKEAKTFYPLCKICKGSSSLFGEADVLRKYPARYFRCDLCGYIQTETPYWIQEAYATAITRSDVGIMERNLDNCNSTAAILNLLFPDVTSAVDYGAGHGVFVRLMRDRGFAFRWFDRYASNDYARGFEYTEGSRAGFLTAFEVLEHLPDPIPDLTPLMAISDNVFVSTCIVPQPPPGLQDWWYYSPMTGQHVSFYTVQSLRVIADHFDRKLLSHGSYHLFTTEIKNNTLFNLATTHRVARVLKYAYHRRSLVESDLREMTR